MFNNCVSYISFKISIQQKLTTFDDSPFNRHDNHFIRSGVILRMRWHVGSKSMGGTNPNTLSGATITVSWEPAKWSPWWSLIPFVSARVRIYRLRYKTLPTGLSFDPLGFPLCSTAHVGRAGCIARTRDTNPTTGLTG